MCFTWWSQFWNQEQKKIIVKEKWRLSNGNLEQRGENGRNSNKR